MPFEYQPGVGSTANSSYASGNKNALNLLIQLMTSGMGDPSSGQTPTGRIDSGTNYNKPSEAGTDFVYNNTAQPKAVSGY